MITRILTLERKQQKMHHDLNVSNSMEFHKKDENFVEGFRKILTHLKMDTIEPLADIDTIYRIKQSKKIIIKFLHTIKRDFFFSKLQKKNYVYN